MRNELDTLVGQNFIIIKDLSYGSKQDCPLNNVFGKY